MHKHLLLLFLLAFLLCGCDIEQRERALEQRANELAKREQALNLRAADLLLQQQQLDSLTREQRNDSLLQIFPQLIGNWNTKMLCNETTCPGSAIGDSKTEQWEFIIENNTLIAIALSNNKFSRIYSGSFRNDQILLEAQSDSTTVIKVRLHIDKDKNLSGSRRIIRADGCYINYELSLKK